MTDSDTTFRFNRGHPYEYEALLKRIHARMSFFDDYTDDEKVFCIRHDEDWDMPYSLNLAREENKFGFRSIYFLNHTCDYFDYTQKFADQCAELIDLGHQIGLHYNALESYILNGTSIIDILSKPLDFLRNNGITVDGASAHGSRTCRENKVLNFEIWTEFENSDLACMKRSPQFDGDIGFERIPLSALSLKYDASLLHHKSYLSDSSGRIWGMVRLEPNDPGRVYDLIEYSELMRGGVAIKNNLFEVIDQFNERVDCGLMHILFHPRWWSAGGIRYK